MAIHYFNCAGFSTKPQVRQEGLPIYVSSIFIEHYPKMLMVCPRCGAEMVAKWKDYDVFLGADNSPSEKLNEAIRIAYKNLNREYKYEETKCAIRKEIHNFLEPGNTCICCGSPLSYEVGYYLNACREHVSELPEQYFYTDRNNHGTFKYPNEDKVKQYALEVSRRFGGRSYGGIDSGIYNYNQLAIDYCNLNGISFEKGGSSGDIVINISGENERKFEKGKELLSCSLSIEQGFEMMRYYRKRLTEEDRDSKVKEVLNAGYLLAGNHPLESTNMPDFSQPEELSKYLFNMIQIETNILSLTKRLYDLYFLYSEYSGIYYQVSNCIKEQKAVEETNAEYNNAIKQLNNKKNDPLLWKEYYPSIISGYPQIVFPSKPVPPEQPNLETPGFFNRKRVEAENSQKTAIYQANMLKWETEVKEWQTETNKLKLEQENQKEEAEKRATEAANRAISEAEAYVGLTEKALKNAKEAFAEKEKAVAEDGTIEKPFNKEVHETEELLKHYAEAKIRYENMNVVFPKYRDLVAYSSFYEYIQTGRCTSLSGSDGAYNLYESEQRQDAIITKLSNVLESLEQIKANQFIIYSQMKEMNKTLNSLNHSMNAAVDSLKKIGESVKNIEGYSKLVAENSSIIAYNTAATAYYTKKNAELTDAMGYLVAFK